MEKWILAWPLWKRGSARGKPCTQKRVTAAVSHRPLPFPTAAKQSRAPLSHRPCCESFYLLQPFLFLTQPDISLAKKSGHFHLLITFVSRSDPSRAAQEPKKQWKAFCAVGKEDVLRSAAQVDFNPTFGELVEF